MKKESVKNVCYIGMMMLGLLLMMHPLQLPLLYSTNGRGYFSFFAGIMLAQMMEKTRDERKNIWCGGALLVFLGSLMLARKWEQLFCVDKFALFGLPGGCFKKILCMETVCLVGKYVYAYFFMEYGNRCDVGIDSPRMWMAYEI